MDSLIAWRESNAIDRKALVIRGLRQVGKTFIVREFAKRYYRHEIYINFKNRTDVKSIFENNFDIDRIMFDLSALMPNIRFSPNDTVLIFDEIQECANARASIKAFVEDGRYDVIATGSLLGISGYNQKIGKGVPTGFEHFVYMRPLDFEEFLWAKGVSEQVVDGLKKSFQTKTPISRAVHDQMLRYFREYICVGGMPSVVNTYLSTGNLGRVFAKQSDLIQEYRDDFGKHLDLDENEQVNRLLLARINEVFDSIPSQLAKENKKFQYSKIPGKGKNSDYREAIQWLVDAGIVTQCFNLSNLEAPLEGNKVNDAFKLYLTDTGLLMAMLGKNIGGDILNGKSLGVYAGAIFENAIADVFLKMERKLYYFRKDSGLEVDFVIEHERETALVEVKARSGHAKSSSTILSNYPRYKVRKCIKFSESNIGEIDGIFSVPYYLAFLLEE